MIGFHKHGKRLGLLLALLLSGATSAWAGPVVYVDASAPAGGDGQTWATAYRYLQDALTAAGTTAGVEFRIAQGTYRPDQGGGKALGDEAAAFHLGYGASLIGGFAGRSSSTPDNRDPKLYVTTLTGEIAPNVQSTMVTTILGSQPALIDGMSITGAAECAVFCNTGVNLTLRNCELRKNGSAIVTFWSSSLALANCIVSGSKGAWVGGYGGKLLAGGISTSNTNVDLLNCSIQENSVGQGVAVVSCAGGSLSMNGCHIARNTTYERGTVTATGADLQVENSLFVDNIVGSGSALWAVIPGDFVRGSPSEQNWAAEVSNKTAIVRKSRFERTLANKSGGGALRLESYEQSEVTDCVFEDNIAPLGGAVYVKNSTSTFAGCTFIENRTVSYTPWIIEPPPIGAGAFWGEGGAINLRACDFSGNLSATSGGAMSCSGVKLDVFGCRFLNNHADFTGGALSLGGCETALVNCIVAGNSAYGASGIAVGSELTTDLIHCLVIGNQLGSYPVINNSSVVRAYNSIFWNGQSQFRNTDTILSHCCVQDEAPGDGQVFPGEGNIDTPPVFAIGDDYHLASGSPCIDAGTDLPAGLPEFDLDGQSRVVDGNTDGSALPDMGPYEYNPNSAVLAVKEDVELFIPHGSETSRTELLQLSSGGLAAEWTISGGEEWLNVLPSSGVCQQNSVSDITLALDLRQLEPGTYVSNLTITSPQAVNSPRLVRIIVHLTAPYHVPWTHSTIQAAMDAAPAGATVLVADGLYTGAGNCDLKNDGKPLTIISEHGPEATRIRSESTTSGFVLTGTDRTIVSGFEIEFSGKPAIFCSQSDPLIENCLFRQTQVIRPIGWPEFVPAISLQDSKGEIRNCKLCNFSSTAIYCDRSSPLIAGCDISHNMGSGLASWYASHPTIQECTFVGNQAMSGGGISCISGSSVSVSNCTFSNNSATQEGGAVYLYDASAAQTTITDSIISGNGADRGGGIYSSLAPVTLKNCELSGNAYGTVFITGAKLEIEDCTIEDNLGGLHTDTELSIRSSWLNRNRGSGIYSPSGVVNLVDCILEANGNFNGFSALVADAGSVNIARCLFLSNTGSRGGAVSAPYALTELAITDSVFSGNIGRWQGGAISCQANKVGITNCLFSGNSSDVYGAAKITNYNGATSILNCAFVGNRSVGSCGGLGLSTQGPLRLTNSIFWGNKAPTNAQGSFTTTGADRLVSRCVIQGGIAGMLGRGTPPTSSFITTADPLFVRPGQWDDKGTADFWDDTWTEGDYRLKFDSPCIDAGDSTALPASVALDLAGLPRFVDELSHPDTGVPGEGRPVVDIGPYEYAPSVLGRYVFYNNSAYDGGTPGANPADDAAIATDKTALLPGQTATLANYINSVRGINGVMLDVSHVAADLTAQAFEFSVLGPGAPDWRAAPLPISISLRRGAGVGGSDRITLIWADKAVPNSNWLRIRVKSDQSGGQLGLAADDVFCFGLAIGETGSPVEGTTMVDATDIQDIRSHFSAAQVRVPVTNPFDVNRDGRVNIGDMAVVQLHQTTARNALRMIELSE